METFVFMKKSNVIEKTVKNTCIKIKFQIMTTGEYKLSLTGLLG